MTKCKHNHPFISRLGVLSVSVSVFAAQVSAQTALPTGGAVASGAASIANSSANSLSINQTSQNAIINWDQFSIGEGNSVIINQPNSSSAILNRVTGSASSSIAGSLSANGQVFLVNPNGIAITKTGTVAVGGGFVASTLGISDEDFKSGNYSFAGNGASASVSNAGSIKAAKGGYVGLLGGSISNAGDISVPVGKIGLGAGEKQTLDINGDGFLQVAVPSQSGKDGKALIDVSGKISAAGGRVVIRAATAAKAVRDAVNISGSVSASSVHRDGGDIVLDGGEGGSVAVTGTVSATSKKSKGGTVKIGGKSISLSGAVVDVSGATGGGAVKLGGGNKGAAVAGLTTASNLSVDSKTTIKADASTSGSGGDIVLWSNGGTDFEGSISAQAFGESGDGGQAEVSGGWLTYGGVTNLLAAQGQTGDLLLDPFNVTISTNPDFGYAAFAATASGSNINTTTLQNALALASVTVSTGAAGAETGNITVNNAVTWNANTTLTLNAAGGVILNAGITASGATSGVTLTAAGTGGVSGSAAGIIAHNGTLDINVNNAAGTGTLAGVISGTGGLTKAGAGTLTISATNTYSGVTNVNAGNLTVLNTSTSLPIGKLGTGNVVVAGGAVLAFNNADTVNNGYMVPNVISGGGSVSYIGPNGGVTSPNSAGNTYTGGTTISSGIVDYSSNTTFGSGLVTMTGGAIRAQTPSLVVANNFTMSGTIGLGRSTAISGNITLAGDTTFTKSLNFGAVVFSGNFNRGNFNIATSEFGPNAGPGTTSASDIFSIASVISGPGTVTHNMAAGLFLSGANTYTGNTFVNAGKLEAGSSTAFGNNSAVTVASGAILDLGNQTVSAGSLSGAGTVYNSPGGSSSLIVGGNNASTLFSGNIITGSGSVGLTKIGTGTLTVSGTNTYFSNTNVNAGTLKAGSTSAFGVNSATTVAAGAVLDLAGFSNSLGSLNGAGLVTNSVISSATLTTGSNAVTANFGGTIQNGAGSVSLTKVGGALQTLSGANTYSGPTTISAGNLSLTGSLNVGAGTATTFVAPGTILSGNGVITAAALSDSGGGTVNLTGPNQIGSVVTTGVVGNFTLNNAQSISLGSINSTGQILITTSAGTDITLASGTVLTTPSNTLAVRLAAGRNFINNSGPGAINLTGTGYWRIYSQSPAADVFNGLNSGNTAIWNTSYPTTFTPGTNRYLFAYQPTLTLSSVNDSKTYGTNATAAVASDYVITGLEPGVAGAYLGDSLASVLSGTPVVTSLGSAASASVAGSPYAINLAAGTTSIISGSRYAIAYASPGKLTVNKANLAVTGQITNNAYSGVSQTNTPATVTGVVNSDIINVTGYGTGTNVGSYADALSVTGAQLGNYNLTVTNGMLNINPAALTVTAHDDAKTYDGLAYSGGNGVTYTGFVNGETTADLGGALAYGGTAQGALNAGLYSITASGETSTNYAITYVAGSLDVNRAALTVTANDDKKAYNGLPYSGGNGVTYAGFVNGETSAVLGGALAYGGSAQGAVNDGLYTLTAFGQTSGNYDISYVAGELQIGNAQNSLFNQRCLSEFVLAEGSVVLRSAMRENCLSIENMYSTVFSDDWNMWADSVSGLAHIQ